MANIKVDFNKIKGAMKPMHGVGQGPFQGTDFSMFKYLKDANIEDEEVSAAVIEIKHIRNEIKQLLEEIDKAEGKITCPKCGSKAPAKSTFCNKCGEQF